MPDHRRPSQATLSDAVLSRIANEQDGPAFIAKWSGRL
jgi:hypothetical protein